MYADDLVLLSISLCELQLLINMCLEEFKNIGMSINITKSCCLRIGKRHNADVSPLNFDNELLPWKQELKYLGVVIASAKIFTVNYQNSIHKYFRAVNSIFGKIGLNTSAPVISSMVETKCVPILSFACESFNINNSQWEKLDNAYLQAYFKIFKTYDKKIVNQCLYYSFQLPLSLQIVSRKLKFLANLNESNNLLLCHLSSVDDELLLLHIKYNLNSNVSHKHSLWTHFENSI